MACEVHQYVRSQGLNLILQNGVKAVQPAADGLQVQLNSGVLDADLVILSVGVRPDTALAKAAGLELTARGCIVVDSHMRTSAPDVYAVGDAVQVTGLCHRAAGLCAAGRPRQQAGPDRRRQYLWHRQRVQRYTGFFGAEDFWSDGGHDRHQRTHCPCRRTGLRQDVHLQQFPRLLLSGGQWHLDEGPVRERHRPDSGCPADRSRGCGQALRRAGHRHPCKDDRCRPDPSWNCAMRRPTARQKTR